MHKSLILIALMSIMSLMSHSLLAQNELPDETVLITKQFEARLADSEMIPLKASLPAPDDKARQVVYRLPTREIKIDYEVPSLRPLAQKREKAPETYRGWIKAGHGMPSSWLGDGSFGFEIGKKTMALIEARHHSAKNKKIENQRFSRTNAAFSLRSEVTKDLNIQTKLGYDSHAVHYYGYDHADTTLNYTEESNMQRFNTIDFHARLANNDAYNKGVAYHVAADVYALNEKYLAVKEQGYKISAGGEKYINDKHPIGIDIIADFTVHADTATNYLNNVTFNPFFVYHADQFSAKLGGKLIVNNDEFEIYPDIELAANIVGNTLGAFLGATGDLQKNTLRTLSTYNPYINGRSTIGNTSYMDFYGGLRGNVRSIEYQVAVGYKVTKDLAFFLNDVANPLLFTPIYDDADIFYFKSNFGMQVNENIKVGATVATSIFDVKNLAKAYHLPSVESNLFGNFKISDTGLSITTDLYLADGVNYLNELGENEKLDALYDLSLGSEYVFSNQFGLFLQAYNLLGNKRQRWNNYPTYGINIMGGLFFKFK